MGSLGPPRGSGGVRRPTRRSRMGREAHLEVQEELGGPLRGLGGVGRPTQRSGRGGRPTRSSWWGREAHTGLGGVGWPTRSSGRGWETHPEVQEASGVCPRDPGLVERLIWSAGRGRKLTCWPGIGRKDYPDVQEAHTEVWEGCGGPCRGTGGVGRPTQKVRRSSLRSGRGWVAHPLV